MKPKPLAVYLSLIVTAAAVLRIVWNDVSQYSTADESIYVQNTRWLVEHGWSSYPKLVAQFIDNS